MASTGKVGGVGNNMFAPGTPLTRAQFVTMIEQAFSVPTSSNSTNPFTDVKQSDWFYQHVLDAYSNKITSGTSATTFGPNQFLKREEAAQMIWNYLSRNNLVQPSAKASNVDTSDTDAWAKSAVGNVMAYALRSDTGTTYGSKYVMTRGDAAALIDLAMHKVDGTAAPKSNGGSYVAPIANPTTDPDNIIHNSDGTMSGGNIVGKSLSDHGVVKTQSNLNLLGDVKFSVNGYKVTVTVPNGGTSIWYFGSSDFAQPTYKGSGAKSIVYDLSNVTNKRVFVTITDKNDMGYGGFAFYYSNGKWVCQSA